MKQIPVASPLAMLVFLVIAAVGALGTWPALAQDSEAPTEQVEAAETPLSEKDVGLSQGTLADVPSPDAYTEDRSDPGEKPLLPRLYTSAPPRVPHNVADLLPITRTDNWCIDCHFLEEAEEGDPTPIPPSHYADFRAGRGEMGEGVVGARWVCVSCHVAQTNAPNLVENLFAEESRPATQEAN